MKNVIYEIIAGVSGMVLFISMLTYQSIILGGSQIDISVVSYITILSLVTTAIFITLAIKAELKKQELEGIKDRYNRINELEAKIRELEEEKETASFYVKKAIDTQLKVKYNRIVEILK